MHESIESLAQRVERLERSNLILKIVNAGVVAAVVAMAQLPSILAGSPVKVLTAQKINLATAGGITLASLAPSPGGSALTFYDSGGHKTVAVGMQADGVVAGLETFDGNTYVPGTGNTRSVFGEASASATSPGVGLAVFDPSAKVRASLGTNLTASLGSYALFYDTTGAVSSGVGYFPASNVTGLFTDYSSTNNNLTSTFFGGTIDDNFAIGESFDHNGMLRSGFDVDYVNDFEGFFSKYPTEPVPNENSVIAGSAIDTAYRPYVGVFDPTAQLRAFMGFGGLTYPAMQTIGANGVTRAGIDTDDVNDFNGFFDFDSNNKFRIVEGIPLNGSSTFADLFDGNEQFRAGIGVDTFEAGAETFTLYSPTNVNEAFLTAIPVSGGTMQTFDATGTQTAHVP